MPRRRRTLSSLVCFLLIAAAPPTSRPRLDRDGQPLPKRALVRLGTTRLQQIREVRMAAFSPDGKTLAVASDNRPVIFWRVADGVRLRQLKSREDGLLNNSFGGRDLHFSPDGKLMAGEAYGCAWVWEVASGKQLRIQRLDAGVSALAFSPDSKVLAAVTGVFKSDSLPIVLWDNSTGREIRRFPGPKLYSSQLVFSPDGKTLTSLCPTTTIHERGKSRTTLGAVEMWDARTGKRLAGQENISAGVLFPDGKRYTRTGKDGRLEVCELTKKLPLRALDARDVRHIVSPDGKLLAGMDDKQTIRIWNVDNGRLTQRIQGHRSAAAETRPHFPVRYFPLAFSPDSKLLATGSCDDGNQAGAVCLWDVAKDKEALADEDHCAAVTCVAIAANSKSAVSGSKDQSVRLWDAATGKPLRCLTGHTGLINAVALSPAGDLVASSSADETIRLWDAATGRQRHSIKAPSWVVSLSFRDDGKTLQVCDLEGWVRLYDTGSGKLRREVRDSRDGSSSLSYGTSGLSPVRPDTEEDLDWHKLLSGPLARQEEADPEAGESLTGLSRLHVSADGRLTATVRQTVLGGLGGPRWRIRVREVATGGLIADLEELGVIPCSLAFSGDGWGLFTGLGDSWNRGSAILGWDLIREKPTHRLVDRENSIVALALSPDGARLASGASDANMLIWDVSSLFQPAKPPPLDQAALDRHWAVLGDTNARAAYRSMHRLASSPEQAVPFLREKMFGPAPVGAEQLRKLIADLDSDRFAERDKASKELERLGEVAEPELRLALKNPPSPEVRARIRTLLRKLSGPSGARGRLQILRAISVLERSRTAKARQALGELAKAAPGALLGKEAQAALERLTWKPIRP
jgi:WD40 repeat protein